EQRAARLSKMREMARNFTVIRPAPDEQRFELCDDALFRYSDQPRGFLDATLWAWGPPGKGGRPAAIAKVEMAVNGNVPFWQFCVASLSDHPLHVDYAEERKLTAVKPGIEFRPLPAARRPPERPALWPLSMKELAGRFTATINARHLDTKEFV